MRRALPWLGLLLLAICFVWFIHFPAPVPSSSVENRPTLRGNALPVIVLDAGHGGRDSGAMFGDIMEKDLTLDVAERAELLLRAAGFRTVLTRESDRYLSLSERAEMANEQKDSLFVSIHFNDGDRETASGVETYYALHRTPAPGGVLSWLPFMQPVENAPLTAKSESLADAIQGALVTRTQAIDRGTKSEQFYVITNVHHPAALVEGGFLNNKSDVEKLVNGDYRQQIALAICDGVQRYLENAPSASHTLAVAATRPE